MTKELSTSTPIKDLLAEHNRRAKAAGSKPLTQWKSGKDKLLARIKALPGHAAPAAVDEVSADYKAALAATAISSRDSIQVASEKLLEAVAYQHDGRKWGLPYDVILAEVQRVFPDCKTTVACLRWYAVKLNEAGVQLPKRKRSRS